MRRSFCYINSKKETSFVILDGFPHKIFIQKGIYQTLGKGIGLHHPIIIPIQKWPFLCIGIPPNTLLFPPNYAKIPPISKIIPPNFPEFPPDA